MREDKLEYEELQDEETSFVAFNEKGDETTYEVLFTFEEEETGKSYIVYTDNTVDDNGRTRVYAASFTLTESGTRNLSPLVNEQEMKIIENALEALRQEFM